jgi:CO/xanthine dehydrogenase Mo-binding subunit
MYFSMGVVAAHLQVPLNKLKFVGGTVGGGFGGKVDTAADTICALLALKSRKAVKWRWTREEEFLASSTRAAWHIELADAVTKDGWILGRRTLTLHD